MASKYSADEADVRALHSEGLGNREIARRLDVPHWFIGKELRRMGLTTSRAAAKAARRIDDEHSECSKCGQAVRNEDFPFVTNRLDGRRLSYCRSCRKLQSRAAVGASPESYWRDKQHRVRRNQKGREFDLPDDYLLEQWGRQEGRCFYSDIKLSTAYTEGRGPQSPSVDRVDQSRGYVVGNVVICADRINSIKRDMTLEEMEAWTPEWHRRAIAHLTQTKESK